MQEMGCSDLDNAQTPPDPHEAQCTASMGCTFVQSAPSARANMLAVINWAEGMGPAAYNLSCQLQRYEDNLSALLQACASAGEKLSRRPAHLAG